jgi:pyruvate kinase
LPKKVRPGERILLDDGLMDLVVLESSDIEIVTRVVTGGLLTDNKGMNLPDASLDIPALTAKDRDDAIFALHNDVDWIALSFVRTAYEVLELKSLLLSDAKYGRPLPIVSKIEKSEAVRNIDSIVEASDAIMVARGDLGIETSPEAVPMVQKLLISKCLIAAKPVITATQMLDSMIRNPRPTRAEASDVANAVLDGTDALMLSGETASGAYPVESVETMVKIAEAAERHLLSPESRIVFPSPQVSSAASAIGHASMQTANELSAKAIVTPTITGRTARFIASFRPRVPIIGVTPSPVVQRQLVMHWGTYPLLSQRLSNTDEVVNNAIQVAQDAGFVGLGDTIVLTAGVVGSVRTGTNLMMVRTIERVLARGQGIGQREAAGHIVHIKTPVNGSGPVIGAQDILLVDRVDESSAKLLPRAGGLITLEKGRDSLGAKMAGELGIPAIIGVEGDLEELVEGKGVILDTTSGKIIEWISAG